MDTVAGPGFCPDRAVPDEASKAVGALAVDQQGRLFFETGSPAAGLVTKVDPDGRTALLATGLAPGTSKGAAGLDGVGPGAGRMTADGEGGIFLAAGRRVVRLVASGELTTFAGDPRSAPGEGAASSGDGGGAEEARFTSVAGVASDSGGNLYIADQIDGRLGTVRIRFVNRTSDSVTFYAGTPHQVVVAPGDIETVAGTAGGVSEGDGGPARLAVLTGTPPALAVAGTRLYLASSRTGRGPAEETTAVRLVNLGSVPIQAHGMVVGPGDVETIGGKEPGVYSDAAGPARSANFSRVPGIAADADGNLLVSDPDHQRLRRIDPSGTVTTIAGTGQPAPGAGGFNGNDRRAVDARLNRPADVKVGQGGNIYVADRGNGQVRVIDRAGVIRAAPGSGVALTWSCTGSDRGGEQKQVRERARPGAPSSIAADGKGNVYLVTADAHQVKKILPSGVVETVAGSIEGAPPCAPTAPCEAVGDGRAARQAQLQRPTALALSRRGDLYVFDAGTRRVRFVNLGREAVTVHGVRVAAGTIETVAGNGETGRGRDIERAVESPLGDLPFSSFSNAGLMAQLAFMEPALGSLAVDGQGNLFIADPANHRVRQVDQSGTITTFAGVGAPPPRDGCCRDPAGLVIDSEGNLFVSDRAPHPRVWFTNRGMGPTRALGQTIAAGEVRAVAGNGSFGFGGDGGQALEAQLLEPAGMVLDGNGSLYIAEVGEANIDAGRQYAGRTGAVRAVDTAGTIQLVAGNGRGGFNGDGLKGTRTSLSFPTGVAFDRCGNLLIADLGNDRLRRLSGPAQCESLPSQARSRRGLGGGWAAPLALALAGVAAAGLVAIRGGAQSDG